MAAGTVTAAEAIDARGNNFLAAVCKGSNGLGLALTDITTGEFRFTEIADDAALFDSSGHYPSRRVVAGEQQQSAARTCISIKNIRSFISA